MSASVSSLILAVIVFLNASNYIFRNVSEYKFLKMSANILVRTVSNYDFSVYYNLYFPKCQQTISSEMPAIIIPDMPANMTFRNAGNFNFPICWQL